MQANMIIVTILLDRWNILMEISLYETFTINGTVNTIWYCLTWQINICWADTITMKRNCNFSIVSGYECTLVIIRPGCVALVVFCCNFASFFFVVRIICDQCIFFGFQRNYSFISLSNHKSLGFVNSNYMYHIRYIMMKVLALILFMRICLCEADLDMADHQSNVMHNNKCLLIHAASDSYELAMLLHSIVVLHRNVNAYVELKSRIPRLTLDLARFASLWFWAVRFGSVRFENRKQKNTFDFGVQ